MDASTPARFNADPRSLFEASGSAGKLAVFAVRLDTFPVDADIRVYYIGTNDAAALTGLRRSLLTEFSELPISGEYLHRDCFDVTRRYGKDTLLMIDRWGTDRLPTFFALKGAMDAWLAKASFLPNNLADRLLQGLADLLPEALPKRILAHREAFEHHLIMKIPGHMAGEVEQALNRNVGPNSWFLFDAEEGKKAMLHRFAAAGAAIRYAAVHGLQRENVLALDIALRRNDAEWFEQLPAEIDRHIEKKLYYGHFLCHVLHQDYIVKPGTDVKRLKEMMLERLDARGAEYPAEHNVGHIYRAKPALAEHYRSRDPTNSFNPGIGKTSRNRFYRETCQCGDGTQSSADKAMVCN